MDGDGETQFNRKKDLNIQDQDRPKEINKYCILIKRYIKIQRYGDCQRQDR